MNKEIWKDYYVENYGNIKVSNYGRVIGKLKELCTHTNSDGYFNYRFHFENYRELRDKNKPYVKIISAHRLVALCFVNNPNNYTEVNHIDGNKQNNYYKNLEWCTRSRNVQHSFDLGLRQSKKGVENGNSILANKDVLKIRKLYLNKVPIAEIARMFEIGWTTVSHIIKGENWTHI
jgi:hypothetical protein